MIPSAHILLAFNVTTATFAFVPGPAMLFTAAQTLARGRRAGLMASLGIHLGGYVHVAAATAGLSVLFQAVPILYGLVKLAGAAYLVWLGIGLLRNRAAGRDPATAAPAGRHAFAESIGVEVLNPKTALFFLAFLPQFVDPSASLPLAAQFAVLGIVVNLTFSAADLVCVLLAGALASRLRRSSRTQRLLRRAGGTVLIGLGAHLALQRA